MIGIGGFYRGLSASYVGCIEGGVQWVIYENLKLRIKKYKENLSIASGNEGKIKEAIVTPFETFVAAAVAKCVAIAATYPHEVVRIRLRESANGAAYKYTGFISTLRMIAKEEGIRGLYGGNNGLYINIRLTSVFSFLSLNIILITSLFKP